MGRLAVALAGAAILLGAWLGSGVSSARQAARACPSPTLYPTPAASIREYAQQVERQEFDLAQRQQRALRGECP